MHKYDKLWLHMLSFHHLREHIYTVVHTYHIIRILKLSRFNAGLGFVHDYILSFLNVMPDLPVLKLA